MLKKTGDFCEGCGNRIVWNRSDRGILTQFNIDGSLHKHTCPKPQNPKPKPHFELGYCPPVPDTNK